MIYMYPSVNFIGVIIRISKSNNRHDAIYIDFVRNHVGVNRDLTDHMMDAGAVKFAPNTFKNWISDLPIEWQNKILSTNVIPNECNPNYVPPKEAKDYPVLVVPFNWAYPTCISYNSNLVLIQDRPERYVFNLHNNNWEPLNKEQAAVNVLVCYNYQLTRPLSRIIETAKTAPTVR